MRTPVIVDIYAAAHHAGVKPGALRVRLHRGTLTHHGYDCHGQNVPSEGLDYRFVDPNYDKRYTGSAREQEVLREEGLDKGVLTMRDADVQFWRAVYDEKIARVRRIDGEGDAVELKGHDAWIARAAWSPAITRS